MQQRVPQFLHINLPAVVDVEGGKRGSELVVSGEVGEEGGEAVEVRREGEFGSRGGGKVGRQGWGGGIEPWGLG